MHEKSLTELRAALAAKECSAVELAQLYLKRIDAAKSLNAFVQVDADLTLEQAKPDDPWKGRPSATYALANGKPLQIAMIEQLPDKRFHMGATIGKDAPDVVRWDAPRNEPVFIAGQSYKDGILVIGITLHEP